ncbi:MULTISPECIES: hypothetical protein [Stenotrophomonas maltophilia group]|uniref:Uncharacterized protein n=2 Tax=Pseudomonadati TaxID=3379134 RepID=A0A246I4U4_STEMA|nr:MULTISPECIES: hypothetical protein [Stenotrophomonas maltophilia group]MBN5032580.1 hypothetical protein [Stenotrophomonas maltophilia]MCZ7844292.1 hypothetical protein [Stenotrophomonas maltophilia]MDJ1626978.1 hypothetical protein [Stenotrophomonas sepilia]OWQ73428.1 hypothetical protein CEE63_12340 [Stenotrophomonas maltophilia]PZT40254.1 hypothetical protein A7X97_04890 [Stenotrophomonas sepilia]
MGQFIPIAIALAGTAAQQAETQRVERKQDEATAQGLLNQSRRQQDADRRVNDEIAQLETSTAADDRAQRLGQYMQQLQRGQRQALSGLNSPIGGATFQADAGAARAGADNAAATTAGLMSRIDAPQLQRQQEAFGYGKLATDLDMEARASRGQQFIDQLRLRQIRRRPEVDLLAGLATSAGGAMAGGGGGFAAAAPRAGANFYGSYDPLTTGYA